MHIMQKLYFWMTDHDQDIIPYLYSYPYVYVIEYIVHKCKHTQLSTFIMYYYLTQLFSHKYLFTQ